MTSINNSLFSIINTSTGNSIGYEGEKALESALVANTTLTGLDLCCEQDEMITRNVMFISVFCVDHLRIAQRSDRDEDEDEDDDCFWL